MKTYVIAKFHEPALKGRNRPMFLRRLADNLRRSVGDVTGVERVWRGHMMIGMTLAENADWSLVKRRVRNCFGVAKFFSAHPVGRNIEAVKAMLPSKLEGRVFNTFRITARRSDKRFPKTSDQINRELGDFVRLHTGAGVDLKNADLEIFVHVLPDEILVYFDEISGYGGMPVGVSGRTLGLLSGGIDSPVAAWHMMKRGSVVDFVHFHSHPLTDTSSIEKATELAQMMTGFQYSSDLFLVPFGDIQKRIIVDVAPTYRVVLYRRFMVRIAEALARRRNIPALVTGESLAQVASQTLDNIAVIDDACGLPVLRPLIGFNKNEIVDVAREIGTFPVSILPDQDCCSLFVPKHPVIHGNIKVVRKLEATLPVDDMVEEALASLQERHFEFGQSLAASV